MLVGFIKRPLGFNHTPKSQIGFCFHHLFFISKDTTHALISNIKYKTNNLWCLSKQSSSLYNIVMIKLRCSWIFIQFKCALDISKIIVFKFKKTWNCVSQMLFILFRPSFIRSPSITLFLNNTSWIIKRTTCNKTFLSSCALNV